MAPILPLYPNNLPGPDTPTDRHIATKVNEVIERSNTHDGEIESLTKLGETTSSAIITLDSKVKALDARVATAESDLLEVANTTKDFATATTAAMQSLDARIKALEAAQPPTPPVPVVVASVSVWAPTFLPVGATGVATATPMDATGKPVTGKSPVYSISPLTVATIDASGTITAKGAGTATITATVDGVKGTAALSVVSVSVGSIVPANGAALAKPPVVTVVSSPRVTATGVTRRVANTAELAAAWSASQGGDEIVVPSGVRIITDMLPFAPRASGGVVIVRGDIATSTKRLASTERATLPHISGKPNGFPVIQSQHGASGLALYDIAITVESGGPVTNDIIVLGNGDETAVSQYPSKFYMDRVAVYAPLTTSMRRGIRCDARDSVISRSRIEDITSPLVGGFDSQGLAFLGGASNWLVEDTYIAAGSENVMFGGWNAAFAVTPGRVKFRRCHFHKKPEWYKVKRLKNWIEFKNGEQVEVDSCVFENQYAGEQAFGVMMFSADQGEGAPWSHVSDVTFRNCLFRNASGFVNLTADGDPRPYTLAPLARVTFDNILVEPINKANGVSDAVAGIIQEDVRDIVFSRATIMSPEYSLTWVASTRKATQRFVLIDSVLGEGFGGSLRSPDGNGAAAAAIYAPDGDFRRSVAIDPANFTMPTGMRRVATRADAGMLPNYSVPGVGCDIVALNAAIAGVAL